MTTDPGDLVLDPTCGSGTTAYVAEQWGRRWITIDTSRVALSLARQRLMTASFPYYQLANSEDGVDGGFVYKTVPHIMLKSIAQNTRIDPVAERYKAKIDALLAKGAQPESEGVQQLRLAQKREIDAIIAEDADQETLYDQPEIDGDFVRVSGPFTVEAIPPAVLSVQMESPIGGAPEPGDAVITSIESNALSDANDDGAVIDRLIGLLGQDGITFPNNKKLTLDDLRPVSGGVIHAEGEASADSALGRVAISFGPQNGAVSVRQVEDGLYAARRGGYDAIVFAGFGFQAEAQQAISEMRHPNLTALMSQIRPDVIMTDARGESLLKTTANSQLFAVFGEPDVRLHAGEDGLYTVELRGVDVYNPLDGTVASARAEQVAAWFLDTDYDGRTFAICQASFPNSNAWEKLERALKGTLDADRFEQLTSTTSLSFLPGEHKRVAAKVIDQRGNEVMRVLHLDQQAGYSEREATR
jgi:adenine-specific DNA-methyltransferase